MTEEPDTKHNSDKEHPDSGVEIQADSPTEQNPITESGNADAATKDQTSIGKIEQEIKAGERWLIWLGFFGLIVNATIGLIYWGQLGEMRKATKAATDAANASTNAVTLQQSSSIIDQRAWVTVQDIFFTERGSSWQISVLFANSGKTPAKQFAIQMGAEAISKGSKPSSKEAALPGQGIIAPNGTFHSNLNMTGLLNQRSNNFFIHGRVSYEDVFGASHWTKFCYYRVPSQASVNGGFAPCDFGNEIDDVPRPKLLH